MNSLKYFLKTKELQRSWLKEKSYGRNNKLKRKKQIFRLSNLIFIDENDKRKGGQRQKEEREGLVTGEGKEGKNGQRPRLKEAGGRGFNEQA